MISFDQLHPLRVVHDTPVSVRRVNRILGLLWSKLNQTMKLNGTMRDGLRLGSNGFRGKLWLVNADHEEISEMFAVVTSERNQLSIVPHELHLRDLANVSLETAQQWADAIE